MSANHEVLHQVDSVMISLAEDIRKGIAGERLPRNVAFALIGYGAFFKAMGEQILLKDSTHDDEDIRRLRAIINNADLVIQQKPFDEQARKAVADSIRRAWFILNPTGKLEDDRA